MRRIYIFLILISTSILLLVSCNSATTELTEDSSSVEENVVTDDVFPTEKPLIILDYADVILNGEFYDEKEVVVAGQIAAFSSTSDNEFDFRDRLGFEEAGTGFTVQLEEDFSYEESASDYYSINDYVLVKGMWNNGPSFRRLSDAVVVATGDKAKQYSDIFMNQWEAEGRSYANTLPITDYMDIINNIEEFDGKRIRTVGKIEALGTNRVTEYKYFSFRDRETNQTCINFRLQGCPQEMQQQCIENEYVVISGIVCNDVGSPNIIECFVESVGKEAELLANESEAAWLQNYQETRENYISLCKDYSYEELARFPESHVGDQIKVSGRVFQIIPVWGENIILLDVGEEDFIYISYVGKQYQEPEILEDDKIVFYGECSGQKTYTTVLGNTKTVPFVIAMYSSMNLENTPQNQ